MIFFMYNKNKKDAWDKTLERQDKSRGLFGGSRSVYQERWVAVEFLQIAGNLNETSIHKCKTLDREVSLQRDEGGNGLGLGRQFSVWITVGIVAGLITGVFKIAGGIICDWFLWQ